MTDRTRTMRELALEYQAAGWCPIELPAGAKAPPPDGRTGYGGSDMTTFEIRESDWNGNVGLRMPVDVIGLDVDAYKGGDETLAELLARCGPLPSTWISHSGRNDGSGIRFYRVPILAWVTGLPGIEIIQRVHRYAVVWPSLHPDGRAYGWVDQTEGRINEVPAVDDLPELPWPWISELSRAQQSDLASRSQAVNRSDLDAFLSEHHQADQPSYVGTILAHFTERWKAGYSRHDTMQHCLIWAMECVRAGIAAGRPTLMQFGDLWVEAVSPDTRRAQLTSEHRTTEFEAMVRHAVGKVRAKPEADILRMHDEIAGIPMRPASPSRTGVAPPEIDGQLDEEDRPGVFLDWSVFAKRDSTDARRWLVEDFWPWGRAMALWASAKTGKSELALWCAVKLALGEHPWTGHPIEPVDIAYFDFEMTESDLEQRLDDFNVDPTRLDRLHYALLPPIHALDVEKGGQEVEALVMGAGAVAAVFDTFSRAVAGDENEADTVRAFYRHTGSRLKRQGIGYLRTDHAGKDIAKGQRGSSAKRDDVDVVWGMTQTKTGMLLDCTGSSRLSWVGPQLAVERRSSKTGISYSAQVTANMFPDGTKDMVDDLDGLLVSEGSRLVLLPADAGKPAVRRAMSANELKGSNAVVEAAIRHRKALGQLLGQSLIHKAEGETGQGGQDDDN